MFSVDPCSLKDQKSPKNIELKATYAMKSQLALQKLVITKKKRYILGILIYN